MLITSGLLITGSVTSPYLIGIVASYLTYTDTAVSKQTGQSRVVFEENSGKPKTISLKNSIFSRNY
jgi:hypothetical protein